MLVLLAGCSFLLPSKETQKNDQWHSFDQVQTLYEKITPDKTTVVQLKQLGFDPYVENNVKIESYLDTRTRFDPFSTGKNIPPTVEKCLKKFDRCYAYVVDVSYDYEKRVGNAFLDLTGFRKEILTTGWSFQAVFVIEEDTVVYKLWSGQPNKKAYVDEIRPLGPLQSLDDFITGPSVGF